MTALRAGSATDVGRRRTVNQDMVLVADSLFAVADGMGGYAGGEVASSTAIDALRSAFGSRPTSEGLEAALLDANAAVQAASRESPDLRNMGTTMVAVALVREGGEDLFAVASIGDSRVYLFRGGELSRLTDDHSVAEELLRSGQISEAEAAVHPQRHMLTRVLGPGAEAVADFQKIVPYVGDRVLLCSDGLYNEVSEREMARVLAGVRNPDDAARQLVDLANEHGGGDNISVIVIDVLDDDDRSGKASAALASEGSPAPPPAAPAATRRPAPSAQEGADDRHLLSADERNARLRQIGRGPDDGPDPWATGPEALELPSRRITLRVVAFVVVLVIILAGAIAAIGWYARGSYYVGLDNGTVTIFKGRPGGLLWFEPTVEEKTDIGGAQVPPSRADDVTAGHETASLAEARRYVANLRDLAALGSTGSNGSTGTTAATTTTAPGATTTSAP